MAGRRTPGGPFAGGRSGYHEVLPGQLVSHETLDDPDFWRRMAVDAPIPHLTAGLTTQASQRALADLCSRATETDDQAGEMYVVLHNLPPQQRGQLVGALTALAADDGPAAVRRWIGDHTAQGGQYRSAMTELHRIVVQAPSLARPRRGRRS